MQGLDDPPGRRLVITDPARKAIEGRRQLGCVGNTRVLLGIAEVPRAGRRPLLRLWYADCASSFAGVAV